MGVAAVISRPKFLISEVQEEITIYNQGGYSTEEVTRFNEPVERTERNLQVCCFS